MRKFALAFIASLTVASPALALPSLKPAVSVTGPVVTVGDLFMDAGDFASTPLFRAPAPGTTGTVGIAEITAAAAMAGLRDFDGNGLAALFDITTIDQHVGDQARAASRMVLDLLAGHRLEEHRLTLPTHLVVRGSTGPAPVPMTAGRRRQ